ncbi:DUF6461 domain-containing protein [Thermoactinospora rubra]|uniref:DUF6461 domain-containing protein n=1 Tax=Thermoactinospora rubra TaxID=1088767 RepID=UPI000A1170AE|nr:DUF6461 domain-containing protein [Thermoactinospora rubra]
MRSPAYLHDLLASTLFTEGLDDEMNLWSLGFSAVWIHGADLAALAPAFSLDLSTRTPCPLSDILDHNIDSGDLWVAEAGGWICILPARDDDAFLRSLSVGGRQVLSFSMDINGHDRFKYIRDGDIVVSFRPTWPDSKHGSDPHALDHLMDGLRFQDSEDDSLVEEDEIISSALALIGRVTGTDIAADWIEATHSRIGTTSIP